jgi:hypothetical protein
MQVRPRSGGRNHLRKPARPSHAPLASSRPIRFGCAEPWPTFYPFFLPFDFTSAEHGV